jgi:hypothetical protein
MKRALSFATVAMTALGFGAAARAETITLKHSEQVLTIEGASPRDGSAVVQSPFKRQPGQTFELKPVGSPKDHAFTIVSALNGNCAEIRGSSLADGAQVIECPCKGIDSQVFLVSDRGADGHRSIRAKHSGKCLAVQDGSTSAGTELVQAQCADVPHQRLRISTLSTDTTRDSYSWDSK